MPGSKDSYAGVIVARMVEQVKVKVKVMLMLKVAGPGFDKHRNGRKARPIYGIIVQHVAGLR